MAKNLNQLLVRISEEYVRIHPKESLSYIENQSHADIRDFFKSISGKNGASILRRMDPETGASVIQSMAPEALANCLNEMDPADIAMLFSRLETKIRNRFFLKLEPALAKDVRELLQYPTDRAGYLMDSRLLLFKKDETVEAALAKLRQVTDRQVTDIFVSDEDRALVGKIPLHTLAVAEPKVELEKLILGMPISINAMAPKDDVVDLMEKYKLTSLPVLDGAGRVIGIIRYDALMEAVQREAFEDIQSMVGVSPDEKALSPFTFAIKKRLPWLGINLMTAFLASSVVGMFEGILSKITALAILLPIVAGQSGNTGAQAQAVTIRGLALREIRSRNGWQVLRKEGIVGLVNGITIGFGCFLAVYLWSHSIALGAVIGTAMVLAMCAASLAGAAIPILLNMFGMDPAQSSSIVLTTITDVVGFSSFLGLATLMSSYLK